MAVQYITVGGVCKNSKLTSYSSTSGLLLIYIFTIFATYQAMCVTSRFKSNYEDNLCDKGKVCPVKWNGMFDAWYTQIVIIIATLLMPLSDELHLYYVHICNQLEESITVTCVTMPVSDAILGWKLFH